MNTPMKGFAPEFRDLDDYIKVITARIWEGHEIQRIHDWYGQECIVITAGGTSVGAEAPDAWHAGDAAPVPGPADAVRKHRVSRRCRRWLSAGTTLHIDSLAERIEAGRTPRPVMRCRITGLHAGQGRYGPPPACSTWRTPS